MEMGRGSGRGDLLCSDCDASNGMIGVVAGEYFRLHHNSRKLQGMDTYHHVYGAIHVDLRGISFVLYMRHTQPAARRRNEPETQKIAGLDA